MIKWVFVFVIFFSSTVYAKKIESHEMEFYNIFSQWTEAFNQKDLTKSCALFSKNLIADYQCVPQKNYNSICDGFKKIFQKTNRRYEYQYRLHDVYQSGDLAAVRITWYLRV